MYSNPLSDPSPKLPSRNKHTSLCQFGVACAMAAAEPAGMPRQNANGATFHYHETDNDDDDNGDATLK